MSRRYTDDEKNEILQHLDDNYGNVTVTAIHTGVPTRTLRDWKRQRKLEAIKNGELPPKKNVRRQQRRRQEEPDTPYGEYTRIRERLMEHIDSLLESLTDDPDTAHLRIIALTRLLDRVIKLESLACAEQPEQVIRIEYQHADGSVHNYPPWALYEDDEDYEPYVPPPLSAVMGPNDD